MLAMGFRMTLALSFATLLFGLATGLICFYFVPIKVSLCDLERHPDWYNQRTVRLMAEANALGGRAIIGDTCCGLNRGAVIQFDEGYIPRADVREFLKHDLNESEPITFKKAEVQVLGRFDKNATMGCFSPEFGIVVTDLELRSPVQFEAIIRQRHEKLRR